MALPIIPRPINPTFIVLSSSGFYSSTTFKTNLPFTPPIAFTLKSS
jgi:hypothetical protein